MSAGDAGLLFICACFCPSVLSDYQFVCMLACLLAWLSVYDDLRCLPDVSVCESAAVVPNRQMMMCAAIERAGTTVSAARSQREAAVAPGNPASHLKFGLVPCSDICMVVLLHGTAYHCLPHAP